MSLTEPSIRDTDFEARSPLSITTSATEWQNNHYSPQPPPGLGTSSGLPYITGPVSTLSPVSPVVIQRQLEIQRRLLELQELVVQNERPPLTSRSALSRSSTSVTVREKDQEHIEELRSRIALLEDENARLATIAQPPAYGHDETVSQISIA
jgi:hypothetical protein